MYTRSGSRYLRSFTAAGDNNQPFTLDVRMDEEGEAKPMQLLLWLSHSYYLFYYWHPSRIYLSGKTLLSFSPFLGSGSGRVVLTKLV